jgi:hypothetical protein
MAHGLFFWQPKQENCEAEIPEETREIKFCNEQ